ncbi:MAG: dienelactone hydrolase family protein [Nitrospiraceae bacterium]|nr:dienelactone hydrolase family protein [Nitrospiraceae bacterium]
MKVLFLLMLFALAVASSAEAKVRMETVEYRDGDTILEGYLAYDDAMKGKRPGVVVVHEWWGLNDYAKGRAEELASLGYVAFAIDMYGKGVRAKTAEEAGKLAGIYRADRKLMRRRADAGLEVLRKYPLTDTKNIAAIGYCFGGGAVLEMARAGTDITGVVSFHGDLSNPNPADAKNIRASVLVLHGADDPFVKQEQVDAFWDEMKKTSADWQVNIYSGAVHSFTNPASGNDPSKGIAYNERAARRAWSAMKMFFGEIFK